MEKAVSARAVSPVGPSHYYSLITTAAVRMESHACQPQTRTTGRISVPAPRICLVPDAISLM